MIVEFPQKIVDEIVDLVADDKATRVATLKDCSLASSQWLYRSRMHLFQKKWFTDATFSKWCEEIRPGEDGPSPHVTVLHYHANFTDAERLTKHHIHLSSFTNLQKLHLRATPIHGFAEDELSMCFKQMGCSVRSISLRACKMTINDLVSFLRLFVKLERLSVIDPIVYSSTLDDSVDFPILGGVLELRYMFIGRDIWDFIHQLSLLPLAFHTVVLEGIHISLLAPINELLATCRESLARIDIRDRAYNYPRTFAKGICADPSLQSFRLCQERQPHRLRCPSRDAPQHGGYQPPAINHPNGDFPSAQGNQIHLFGLTARGAL